MQFFPYIGAYTFGEPSHKRPFSKMVAQKACGHDVLWTVGWIVFKFEVVVICVYLCLLGRTKWLIENKWPLQKLVGAMSYEPFVWSISNFMLWFWGKNPLKTRWLIRDILKKLSLKKLVGAKSWQKYMVGDNFLLVSFYFGNLFIHFFSGGVGYVNARSSPDNSNVPPETDGGRDSLLVS